MQRLHRDPRPVPCARRVTVCMAAAWPAARLYHYGDKSLKCIKMRYYARFPIIFSNAASGDWFCISITNTFC